MDHGEDQPGEAGVSQGAFVPRLRQPQTAAPAGKTEKLVTLNYILIKIRLCFHSQGPWAVRRRMTVRPEVASVLIIWARNINVFVRQTQTHFNGALSVALLRYVNAPLLN